MSITWAHGVKAVLLALLIATLYQILTFEVEIGTPELSAVAGNDREAVLEAQLLQAQEYQEELIQTVYFTLGGVVTVAALVAGFAWYQNRVAYERDLDSLRSSLQSNFEQFRNEVNSLSGDLGAEVDNRIGSRVVTVRDELTSQFETSTGQAVSLFEAMFDMNRRLDMDIMETKARFYESQGEQGLALTYWINHLETNLRRGENASSYWMANALNGIGGALDGRVTLLLAERQALLKVIEQLPENFEDAAERLRAQLDRID